MEKEHRRTSFGEKYLKEAEELLEKRDHALASQRLWGVASLLLKAIAASRGRTLGTPKSLWEFVDELDQERPDWRLMEGLNYANTLRTNFYEKYLTERQVSKGAQAVRELVERLNTIL